MDPRQTMSENEWRRARESEEREATEKNGENVNEGTPKSSLRAGRHYIYMQGICKQARTVYTPRSFAFSLLTCLSVCLSVRLSANLSLSVPNPSVCIANHVCKPGMIGMTH